MYEFKADPWGVHINCAAPGGRSHLGFQVVLEKHTKKNYKFIILCMNVTFLCPRYKSKRLFYHGFPVAIKQGSNLG